MQLMLLNTTHATILTCRSLPMSPDVLFLLGASLLSEKSAYISYSVAEEVDFVKILKAIYRKSNRIF